MILSFGATPNALPQINVYEPWKKEREFRFENTLIRSPTI